MSVDTGKFALKDSLCWHCSRATDGSCSWSNSFIPVDGWDAEKSVIKGHYSADTFFVKGCPLFAKYEPPVMDDIGVEKLSDAVMARAGRDYLDLMEHEKNIREQDKALGTKRALYGNWTRRNREPIKWNRFSSDTWKTLYNFEIFDNEILAIERFFKSEKAEMFATNINPIYIMETIQKKVGLRHEVI